VAVRLVGYVRVSRVAGREGDSFISPAVQRERIEAQAVARGDVLVRGMRTLTSPDRSTTGRAFRRRSKRWRGGGGRDCCCPRSTASPSKITDAV
jgi:hypothetical protein